MAARVARQGQTAKSISREAISFGVEWSNGYAMYRDCEKLRAIRGPEN
jgi:hypothetical protein